jgi:hypothetical protein
VAQAMFHLDLLEQRGACGKDALSLLVLALLMVLDGRRATR